MLGNLETAVAKANYEVFVCRIMHSVDFIAPTLSKCSPTLREVELGLGLHGAAILKHLPKELPCLKVITIHPEITLETAMRTIAAYSSSLISRSIMALRHQMADLQGKIYTVRTT